MTDRDRNQRGISATQRRLDDLKEEGIKILTYEGGVDSTRKSFYGKWNVIFPEFNEQTGLERTLPLRLGDGSVEFISDVITLTKCKDYPEKYYTSPGSREVRLENLLIGKAYQYALREGFVTEVPEELKVEVHMLYEPAINLTHYFILPARSYIKEEKQEFR